MATMAMASLASLAAAAATTSGSSHDYAAAFPSRLRTAPSKFLCTSSFSPSTTSFVTALSGVSVSLRRLRETRVVRRRNGFGAGSSVCVSVATLQRLDEVEAMEMSPQSKDFPASPGIYAVFDKEGKMQFIGISRRVSNSLQAHLQDLPELCGSVKIAVVDQPDRSALTEAWTQWVQEHVDATGEAPPGNVTGVTTWTKRKPRASAKPELKLTPGPHKELNIPLSDLIDKVVKEIPVVAFIKGTRMSPQCGFSHRVLTILNETGVDFEVVNVLDDHFNPGLREAIKTYSQWPTIPQLYVKGEFVGGADILDQMVESGEIKTFFTK